MPGQSDFGVSELHETIRGGERVLIGPARPEDMALYQDFLRNVSAEESAASVSPSVVQRWDS
jgi:hypothetical protein